MPQYPGGEMELKRFIATNVNYPEAAGTQKPGGRPVNVCYTLPVTFSLPKTNPTK